MLHDRILSPAPPRADNDALVGRVARLLAAVDTTPYTGPHAEPADREELLREYAAVAVSATLEHLEGPKTAGTAPVWCPVCHTYHVDVGEKTDAGRLTRQCPRIPADDPRNVFANYPGR